MNVYVLFLLSYVLMIIFISFFSRKKIKDASGYLLGGRKIPPWMSAFSYGTAYFSAVLFIGYAGKIGWQFGFSALWIVAGNTLIGTLLAWKILGKKTREITHRINASTMPEFIEMRYKSKALKVITASIIFIFLVPYAASVYKGLGYLFEEIFGIPNIVILLIMMALTAFYLFTGGFIATTLADFIQGCIMIVGVILMIIFIMIHPSTNGLVNIFEQLKSIDIKLASPIGPPGLLPIASLVILTSLGSWGLPQMVHKFYTIRDEASIKSAQWISAGFALLITFGAYFTGIVSRLVLDNQCPSVEGIPVFDRIIPLVINETLPNVVAAIILVLVLSASMSTLASVVLAASSAVAIDLLKVVKPDISNKRAIYVMRSLCVIFVVASFILATMNSPILNLASLSWGAVSGSLLAPYLLGLYWKRGTKQGVYAGIITSLVTIIYGIINYGFKSPYIPTVSALAILLPIVSMIVVSLLTKPFDKEHVEYIYNTNNNKRGDNNDLVTGRNTAS